VHLVIARHRYKVEQVVRLLKGAATKQLLEENLHPLMEYCTPDETVTPWADRKWKVFLDSDEAIQNAIRYVEENPEKEGKPRQHWSFVQLRPAVPGIGFGLGNVSLIVAELPCCPALLVDRTVTCPLEWALCRSSPRLDVSVSERSPARTLLSQDTARRRGLPVKFTPLGRCLAADPLRRG